MSPVHVVLAARVFLQLLVRLAEHPGSRVGERPACRTSDLRSACRTWMWSASGRVQRSTTCSASLCGLAFSSIQTFSSLNPIESITSVSPSQRPISSPKNDGSGSSECLRAVDRDQAEVAVPVEERDLLGALQHLERQAAGVVPRDAADDAQALGIDRRREVVLQRGLAGRRQRQLQAGQILADVAARHRVARAFPVAAEIGMAVGRARRRPRLRGLVVDRGQSCARRRLRQKRRAERRRTAASMRHVSCSSRELLRYRAGACVSAPWSAVAGRRAGDDAAVSQRHAARVHHVRAVLGAVAVDDDRVAELEVAPS